MKAGNRIALALAASLVLCLAVLAAAFLCMSYLTKAKDLPENQVALSCGFRAETAPKKRRPFCKKIES